jgi:hypothetical protein
VTEGKYRWTLADNSAHDSDQFLVDADACEAEAAAGDPGFAKLAGWNIPADLREDSEHLVRQRGPLLPRP